MSGRPAAAAHRQSVEWREAHGGGLAGSIPQGAQAGTLAEVGEDHPAIGRRAEAVGQTAGEVLVGQAVETIGLHPGQLR